MAKNIISGAVYGPGPNGEIIGGFNPNGTKTVKPITFLGGTVLSFNATLGIGPLEESSLTLELINDCAVNSNVANPQGDFFLGEVNLGAPVYFDLGEATAYEINRQAHEQAVAAGDKEVFKFGGILQSYTANQGSGGLTFSARVVDPRFILSGVTLVISGTAQGPTMHRNYYNVFGSVNQYMLAPEVKYEFEGDELLRYPPSFDQNLSHKTSQLEIDRFMKTTDNCASDEFDLFFGRRMRTTEQGTKASHILYNLIDRTSIYKEVHQPYTNVEFAGNGDDFIDDQLGFPIVYSPNYGTDFSPPLTGRENTVAQVNNLTKHRNNVMFVDLTDLFLENIDSVYIPGPTVSLLDFISQICEATGYIFHVTLEPRTATNGRVYPVIKIHVQNVNKIANADSFKSEILSYDGSATNLSYGKELSTEKTRSIMVGEKKHLMYETTHIMPYFGKDKYDKPIVPEDGDECGFLLNLYLDDLSYELNCPLYDVGVENDVDLIFKENLLTRKVQISEYHIRAAMSSMEVWKRYVFNPWNMEDMSCVIRRNFPGLRNSFLQNITTAIQNIEAAAEPLVREENQPAPSAVPPAVPANPVPAPDHPPEAAGQALPDLLGGAWNARMLTAIQRRQEEDLEKVYNYLSTFGRTYYGKQFVAVVPKNVCVADYYAPEIPGVGGWAPYGYVNYRDTCTGKDVIVRESDFESLFYSHEPTNDGAWIEECGSVLGLGSRLKMGLDTQEQVDPNEIPYLDFFRTEDRRVGPIARFDSRTQFVLNRTTALINESWIPHYEGVIPPGNASDIHGVYRPAGITTDVGVDELIASGVCGDLDLSTWSNDDYVKIRYSGYCTPPTTGLIEDPLENLDLPTTVYSKFSVGEKIYTDDKDYGCFEFKETIYEPIRTDNNPCCGKWQSSVPSDNPLDCYWDPGWGAMPGKNDCFTWVPREVITKIGCGDDDTIDSYVLIPIIFDEPCFTTYCKTENYTDMIIAELEFLYLYANQLVDENGARPITYVPGGSDKNGKSPQMNRAAFTRAKFCGTANITKVQAIEAVLDANSVKNQKFTPSLFVPNAVAIPIRSNIETYGPWYSDNFETSSGGIDFIEKPEFSPWFFNGQDRMTAFAKKFLETKQTNRTELETGSITIPNFPDKPLGFIANGPSLSNINVSVGSNGVTSIYNYRTFTPNFGSLAELQMQALQRSNELERTVKRLAREKQRKIDTINRKINKSGGKGSNTPPLKLTDSGTLQRVIVGQTYPFSNLYETNYITIEDPENEGQTITVPSGYTITGSGTRTVVGTETLQKSILELRYNYEKKAFMSWDGLLSPVSVDGDGNLPMYAAYNPNPSGSKSLYNSPNPPVWHSGKNIYNIDINRDYSNPLTNPFASGDHHHIGDGAGHNVDIVGRGSTAPESGIVMNFYGKSHWHNRYTDDYRFLGLRGPLVLHQWGYDTQGKPIPNLIDDEDIIKKSGVFRTTRPTGEIDNSSGVYMSGIGSGLSDYFLRDWLHKPDSWPVAPVDLRFDRQRGMWVSPPDYKIVVVEASDSINSYSSGSGVLVNERDGRKYNPDIFDASGNIVGASGENSKANILIEDRIGRNISAGEKSYAYFDSFTSTYLLMGGGGGGSIKIGKFCNQWPSLSNVKDPANAVKKVVLYENSTKPSNNCPTGSGCAWNLQPVLTTVSGVEVPKVVEAINLFSNVAAAEYQTKWCAIVQNGNYYYLLAAEC